MSKFWEWKKRKVKNIDTEEEGLVRTLFLNGVIAEESWFDDEITPALFKSELGNQSDDITVWINSPGGDCFAAAQIYNMLTDYRGKVTVKIDGIAASAASVIAMAGDEVLVSPVSMLMIHNPSTIAMGEAKDMEKAIAMLDEVKNSIINAYAIKTGLSKNKLSTLMDNETWMNAKKAVELHFADDMLSRNKLSKEDEEEECEEEPKEQGEEKEEEKKLNSLLYPSRKVVAIRNRKLMDFISDKEIVKDGRSTDELLDRLYLIKNQF